MLKRETATNNTTKNVETKVTPKKKQITKTQKLILIVCSIIVALLIVIGGWCLFQIQANKWNIKTDAISIEYGETYEPKLEDLVDIEKYSRVTEDNTSIDLDLPNEADKEYPSVGEYNIIINHKIDYRLFNLTLFSSLDSKTVILQIADTTSPIFPEDAPTEIETYKDCQIENLADIFKATDLSEIEYNLNYENVDIATVGEYATNIYATDKSGNVANKEWTIVNKVDK